MGMFSTLAAQQQGQPASQQGGISPQIMQMLMQQGWAPPQQQGQPQQGAMPGQMPLAQSSPVTSPQGASQPTTNPSVMPTGKQMQQAMMQANQKISNGWVNNEGGLAAAGTPLNANGQMTLPGTPTNNTNGFNPLSVLGQQAAQSANNPGITAQQPSLPNYVANLLSNYNSNT